MPTPQLCRGLTALQRLQSGQFAAPAAGVSQAAAALRDAEQLIEALAESSAHGEQPDAALCAQFASLAAALCSQLEHLDAPMQERLLPMAAAERSGQAGGADDADAVQLQLLAGTCALLGCITAASQLSFGLLHAQEVVRGAALVFGAGSTALQALLHASSARQAGVRCAQVQAQLKVLQILQCFLRSEGLQPALADFNVGTGAAERVEPCLTAMARLLLSMGDSPAEGIPMSAHQSFAEICQDWLSGAGFSPLHAPLLAAAEAGRLRGVAEVLLRGLQPAAGCELMPAGGSPTSHPNSIGADHIDPLLRALLSAPMGAAVPAALAGLTSRNPAAQHMAFLRHAGQLLTRLPLDAPLPEEGAALEGLLPQQLSKVAGRHLCAVHLLGMLYTACLDYMADAGQQVPSAEASAVAANALLLVPRMLPLARLLA
ncbi:hypothetical protein ABPG75_013797 [Micractinium tetrahymenae]